MNMIRGSFSVPYNLLAFKKFESGVKGKHEYRSKFSSSRQFALVESYDTKIIKVFSTTKLPV